MKKPLLFAFAASIAYAGAAHAQAGSSGRTEDRHLFNPSPVPFEPYEPSYLGYSRDTDDVGFMDFKISVKYPVFREGICSAVSKNARLYFAFTGRWSQYVATRYSSPVIAKRFNPKMAWRQTLDYVDDPKPGDAPPAGKTACYNEWGKLSGTYVEVAFGHESNGQAISTAKQLTQAEDNERAVGDNPAFARDKISRGWDVFEVTWRKPWYSKDGKDAVNGYVIAKYFLSHGPFQGRKEEFDSTWESDPEGKPRSHVNGLGAIAKWQREWEWGIFTYPKIAAVFETGYARPFRYNTYRIEAGVRIFDLPVTVWGQSGYGSDLAQYYKKVKSRGIELEIGSF